MKDCQVRVLLDTKTSGFCLAPNYCYLIVKAGCKQTRQVMCKKHKKSCCFEWRCFYVSVISDFRVQHNLQLWQSYMADPINIDLMYLNTSCPIKKQDIRQCTDISPKRNNYLTRHCHWYYFTEALCMKLIESTHNRTVFLQQFQESIDQSI